jgi:hypothetical protein
VIFAAAACWIIAAVAISRTDGQAAPAAGPTTGNALAAEQKLTRAFLMNDADAIGRLLDDDWAVVRNPCRLSRCNKVGQLYPKDNGDFNSRVRIYGNIALVTTQWATLGLFAGSSSDVRECQTGVLLWRDGLGSRCCHLKRRLRNSLNQKDKG